jgi:23S rRNA (guanosine2251-2'-O)-methyltransferase
MNDPERLRTDALRARKGDRADFASRPRTPIAVVLDGVHGPYNQGALFRLADGFLLEHLHFCRAELILWNRRFKKAARGTIRWVPHSVHEDTVSVVEAYRSRGYQIVAAEQATRSVPIWQAELRGPLCLILGAEMDGVSDAVLALADVVVEFPTLGMANSLNVSMSAAMLVASAYGALAAQP